MIASDTKHRSRTLLEDLFGVHLSRGSVGRLRDEMSEAIREPVSVAKGYIHTQPMVHSDETSFPQGNRDSGHPKRTTGWSWVLVTPLVSFFEVVWSRSPATAKALIGDSYRGVQAEAVRLSVLLWYPPCVPTPPIYVTASSPFTNLNG
jgi:hypothetical protein